MSNDKLIAVAGSSSHFMTVFNSIVMDSIYTPKTGSGERNRKNNLYLLSMLFSWFSCNLVTKKSDFILMKRKFNRVLLLYIVAFLSFFIVGGTVQAQPDFSPKITIEDAIKKARQYADQNDIDLNGKYINWVTFHNNMQNRDQQPYWSIRWINRRVTKGGGVELRLNENGSIEVHYLK